MNSSSDAKNPRQTQDRNQRAAGGLDRSALGRAARPDPRISRSEARRPQGPDAFRSSLPSLTDEDIRRAEWEGMTPSKPPPPHEDDDDLVVSNVGGNHNAFQSLGAAPLRQNDRGNSGQSGR